MNKYTKNFKGNITVMIDESNVPGTPYGVYSFVENTLVGAFYYETEEKVNEKYKKIIKELEGVSKNE